MKTKEPTAPKLACIFYKTDAGTAPARDWLREQPPTLKKKIGDDIRVVQYTWPIGRPLVGILGAGLFEVRTSHFDNDYRVLFSDPPRGSEAGQQGRYGPRSDEEARRRQGHREAEGPGGNEGEEEREAMSENKHHGPSFESFLVEEGIFDEVDQSARKRVLAEQLRALMKRRRVTPTKLATRMSTSRAAVYRLLDAEEGTTLDSLARATHALGADLVVKIVTRTRAVAARRVGKSRGASSRVAG